MGYLSRNFLLHGKSAERLYFEYAKEMPIFDYHCHLPPRQIAEDTRFETITQVWLGGDHYKWRVMRNNGVDEKYITGTASDREKFMAWASTLPHAVRNPIYDWAHLELKQYFGIDKKLLSEKTGGAIYEACNEKLAGKSFSVRNLLIMMKVKNVSTTDDPVDDLAFHDTLKKEKFAIPVLPTFRPDKAMAVDDPASYNRYVDSLAAAAGVTIQTYTDLLAAIDKRHKFFHEHGCRAADHALEFLSTDPASGPEAAAIFSAVRSGKTVEPAAVAAFKTALLLELCRMNHSRGWAQQVHVGVIRNVRRRIFEKLGPDAGTDVIGDASFGRQLCRFFDTLDAECRLARTILFNINPGDFEMFQCIAAAFGEGPVPGKMQLGPAWWFLDQKDGIVRHLDTLSNFGLLSRFVGMTTDSRSFLSFPRHDYFRRILCNLLGSEMEAGDLPGDFALMGGMVRDICHNNARNYFT